MYRDISALNFANSVQNRNNQAMEMEWFYKLLICDIALILPCEVKLRYFETAVKLTFSSRRGIIPDA